MSLSQNAVFVVFCASLTACSGWLEDPGGAFTSTKSTAATVSVLEGDSGVGGPVYCSPELGPLSAAEAEAGGYFLCAGMCLSCNQIGCSSGVNLDGSGYAPANFGCVLTGEVIQTDAGSAAYASATGASNAPDQ